MGEVLLTKRARKNLDALDPPVRRRVIVRLRELNVEPLSRAVRLTDPRLGGYRVRVGDWRIVFDLEDDDVVVLRIGHRREIYRH